MEIVKGKIGNAITSTASDHIVAVAHDIYDENQERYQDDINDYVLGQIFDVNQILSCFSSGLWENELHWSNVALWDNNKFAITEDLQNQIDELEKVINEHTEDLSENILEHQSFKIQLQNHLSQLKDLECLTKEHDEQILDLLNGLNCFGDGQWGDLFVWDNEHLWANEPGIVANMQEEISVHESRLSALETALTELLNINKAQQEQLERQQSQLDALMDVFTVTNIGKWQNALLWDNNTKWSDSLLTQQIENGSGTASVTVKSYDVETGTISI